jgi:beta-glucanase (GH16 family)
MRQFFSLQLLSCLLFIGIPMVAMSEEFKPPSNYRLVWSDEFNQDGLPDPSKWAYDTERNKEGWHNNELQYYSGPRRENAEIKNGILHIHARKEALKDAPDWGRQQYTATRLITRGKADWTYGFFEVRAKMPCGKGTWPAIWTLGTKGQWPDDGELDIMEHMGHTPGQTSSAVHVKAGHAGQAVGGVVQMPDACTAFHRYQMHWTPHDVVFGVDGKQHVRFPKMAGGKDIWPFDHPQYLLLNLAIGGDLGGPVDDTIFPVSFQVDYVRVYQGPKPK